MSERTYNVLFLCTGRASYLTGTTAIVDGGVTASC